jgi:ABC-type nitrate/sulfonate/bicarbonate transport system permease component
MSSTEKNEDTSTHTSRRRGAALLRALSVSWPPLSVVLLAFCAWALLVRVTGLPSFILPSPADVMAAARDTGDLLAAATLATLLSTVTGLAIAVGLGALVAATIDLIPFVRRSIYPLLVASQTVQILAIAPLLVIWLGFGRAPTVVIVVLFTFFPMAIATSDGLAQTDRDYVLLLRSMDATRGQIFRRVRLPGALPSFFSGLRLSVTYSVVAATIGEWVGGSQGLGLYMLRSKNALKTDQVFTGMLITTAISIALFGAVYLTERIALPWQRARRQEQWQESGIY